MKDTKPRRQLNSLDEAASILGISISTLRSHVAGGAVHVVRLGGRIFVHDLELARIQTEGIPTTIADYKAKAT
jgi:predicted site-specific integrase-resolvase